MARGRMREFRETRKHGETWKEGETCGRWFRRGRETLAERGRWFRRGREILAERGRRFRRVDQRHHALQGARRCPRPSPSAVGGFGGERGGRDQSSPNAALVLSFLAPPLGGERVSRVPWAQRTTSRRYSKCLHPTPHVGRSLRPALSSFWRGRPCSATWRSHNGWPPIRFRGISAASCDGRKCSPMVWESRSSA